MDVVKIQEVHRIDIDRFAQIGGRINGREVYPRRDVAELFLNHLAHVDVAHSFPTPARVTHLGQKQCTRMSICDAVVAGQCHRHDDAVQQRRRRPRRATTLPMPTMVTCSGSMTP